METRRERQRIEASDVEDAFSRAVRGQLKRVNDITDARDVDHGVKASRAQGEGAVEEVIEL